MRFLFFLLIIYFPLKAISQHQEPNIFIGKDAPIWMQEFSKKDRNVQSITEAYSNYYKKNPFVKSTYTQFY